MRQKSLNMPLGPNLLHLLKTEKTLETLGALKLGGEPCVHITYWDKQDRRRQQRDAREEEGRFRIAELNFDRQFNGKGVRWTEPVDNGRYFHLEVFPIPTPLVKSLGLSRDRVAEVFSQALAAHPASNAWRMTLGLVEFDRQLELAVAEKRAEAWMPAATRRIALD